MKQFICVFILMFVATLSISGAVEKIENFVPFDKTRVLNSIFQDDNVSFDVNYGNRESYAMFKDYSVTFSSGTEPIEGDFAYIGKFYTVEFTVQGNIASVIIKYEDQRVFAVVVKDYGKFTLKDAMGKTLFESVGVSGNAYTVMFGPVDIKMVTSDGLDVVQTMSVPYNMDFMTVVRDGEVIKTFPVVVFEDVGGMVIQNIVGEAEVELKLFLWGIEVQLYGKCGLMFTGTADGGWKEILVEYHGGKTTFYYNEHVGQFVSHAYEFYPGPVVELRDIQIR
jgi:hypothetical protein